MNFKTIKKSLEHQNDSRLSDAVLKRIEKEDIKPCPRWQFWCRYSSIWVLWTLSVIMGAVSVAVMLYVTEHARYSLYEATHASWSAFLFEIIPYLWIVTLILMVGMAYYNFRCTKRGYRYSLWQVVVSSVVVSVLGGVVLNMFGAGYYIDTALGRSMETYPSMERMEMKMWQMPDAGRIVGTYEAMSADDMFYIVNDAHDSIWKINVTELRESDLELLSSGRSVRLLGTTTNPDGNDFHACGVFPWMFDKRHSQQLLQKERDGFVNRMYEHMEADDRLEALEREVYEIETYDKSFMDGLCADIAAVKRVNFE